METIMRIHRELEYLQGLVKLAKRIKMKRLAGIRLHLSPAIIRISMNETYRRKTMHLLVEINNGVIEGLVDTGASMSVMVANIVRKFGIMHLVLGHETYKMTFGTITIALGRLDDIHVCVDNAICNMVFLVVDTNKYDLLLSLDFLVKIGAMVEVKKAPYRLGIDLG
jgi:hypothetical protein